MNAPIPTDRWYYDRQNVLELGRWLVDIDYFIEIDQVISFFEKPWKFDDEWNAIMAWSQSQDPEEREYIVQKVLGEAEEPEESDEPFPGPMPF